MLSEASLASSTLSPLIAFFIFFLICSWAILLVIDVDILNLKRLYNRRRRRRHHHRIPSSSSDSNWEEDLERGEPSKPPRKKYKWHDRRLLSAVEECSEETFADCFRMSKACFDKLFSEVAEYFDIIGSSNGKSISAKESLLIFLYNSSGDIRSKHASFCHGYSPNVVRRVCKNTVLALCDALAEKYIRLLSRSEAIQSA